MKAPPRKKKAALSHAALQRTYDTLTVAQTAFLDKPPFGGAK